MNNTENNPPEFKDKIEALEFMVKRSADKKRKEKWAKDFAVGRKKNKPSNIIPLRKRIIQISAVAAVLILGFIVVQFLPLSNPNLESLAKNMIQDTKFHPQEVTRGTTSSDEEINKAILKSLESENYQEAVKLYSQKTGVLSLEDKFFYAVSLAKTNSPNQNKILELTSEIMQMENEFYIESLWIRALTNLNLKNTEVAKVELEQLVRYKYQTKNVKKLLSKIPQN